MIRISRTLLLSFTAATAVHGMENTTPKIEITTPKVEFTSSIIEISSQKPEPKHPSTAFTQSTSSRPSRMTPPRTNKIQLPSSTSSTSSSIESSPRIIETSPRNNKYNHPSNSLTQSISPESSPRTIEKKHHSTSFNQSASSISSRENSPRDNEPKRSSTLLTEVISSLSDDSSETENPLLEAVKNNNLKKVQMILNINIPDKEGDTSLIIAARNDSKKMILELLKQPSLKPNMQNLLQMTALLCAAQKGHRKIVNILVLDPRIDSSITELNNFSAQHYLNLHENCTKLKIQLFGRITLDTFVNKEVAILHNLINKNMLAANLTDQDFKLSIKTIKNNITDIANNQKEKDRKLSSSAIIPEYASDGFIKQMIKWRLFYCNQETLSSIDRILLWQQSQNNNK